MSIKKQSTIQTVLLQDKRSDRIVDHFLYACHMLGFYPTWENSYPKQIRLVNKIRTQRIVENMQWKLTVHKKLKSNKL